MPRDIPWLAALRREFEQEKIFTAWRRQFPAWNTANLETVGVLSVEASSFAFVERGHPAIAVLRHNKAILGADIDAFPMVDGRYFKIAKGLLQQCFSTIRALVYDIPRPARPMRILKLQQWARGQPLKRRQARTLALCMAFHPRLGAACALHTLDADMLNTFQSHANIPKGASSPVSSRASTRTSATSTS